ncbi:2-phospho-L-lactate transferase CofD family protein [Gammaproteobacteria bacterium]|nr:2-phospho-L-lactate transferase CofD family protein [Gammaproteobacteria bacterium]
MQKVVVLNGGRGAASIIPSLIDDTNLHVTSIVNAYDDGKSTGEIRNFFGMLGPSDIRKVQELMLPKNHEDYKQILHLFQFRYPKDIKRLEVLKNLEDFAANKAESITGVSFSRKEIATSLRLYVNEFFKTLLLIERVESKLFNFSDCSIMNCIYAGAFLYFDRNIEKATIALDELFELRGSVLATNIEDKKLLALRENGEMLYSEAEVVELRSNVRIERIYLLDKYLNNENFENLTTEEKRSYLEKHQSFVEITPSVKKALAEADIIIYSSGTQHSSLYPTYMSKGIAPEIANNKEAIKIFITNIGADYESPSYQASDFINGAWKYLKLSDDVDYKLSDFFSFNLVNQSINTSKDDDSYVKIDKHKLDLIDIPCIIENFESSAQPGKHDGNKVHKKILDLQKLFQSNL